MALSPALVFSVSVLYLGGLFLLAYWAERRANRAVGLLKSPWVYALSIGVYCTSWTYYGSVGRAATSGVGFLTVYLGPTLTFLLGWFLVGKIMRICHRHRITSIADFISSRYGKSHLLGGMVSLIAFLGTIPYIALQLKAVWASYLVITAQEYVQPDTIWMDKAFYVALAMAVFTIIFGTRHIDATEQHEGMVSAIAAESLVKLVAFLSVGCFVVFGLFDGAADLFEQARQRPELAQLMRFETAGSNWFGMLFLSMGAVLLLPRQFQAIFVENKDETHLSHALWQFPLYLLLINLFVLPIALAGLIYFQDGSVDADTFVLALPLAAGQTELALFVFIGGLSAATGMVIVATIALATMVCNDLVMPLVLRQNWERLNHYQDMGRLLLWVRRSAIILILFLAYLYFRVVGESYALVSIGLVSFCAAAQFAPALIGGIYWKGASRRGAVCGLAVGFVIWIFTLVLPAFIQSGWLPSDVMEEGLWGLSDLKPYAVFGLTGLDPISHSLFWSMVGNVGAYVGVSLFDRQSAIERIQATLFVEVNQQAVTSNVIGFWGARVEVKELLELCARYLGEQKAREQFQEHAMQLGMAPDKWTLADAVTVQFSERLLAGVLGAASARVLVASVVKGRGADVENMLSVLDEASHVIEYSHQLERKSHELETATIELQEANRQLRELDRLKDDFLSHVAHELRTPLTSIRGFSEILSDHPDLELAERQKFLSIMVEESQRLTRLVNQVLDLAKIESGRMKWDLREVDVRDVVAHALTTLRPESEAQGVELVFSAPRLLSKVKGDRDRLIQVVINLIANAIKVYEGSPGRVEIALEDLGDAVRFSVKDFGPGLEEDEAERVFEKFYQAARIGSGNPTGSGLGLTISQRIIEHLDGRIWVESTKGKGATFYVVLPYIPWDFSYMESSGL